MKLQKSILFLLFLIVSNNGFSQPFVDVANLNYQRFTADYKNDASVNTTAIYNLNLLLPKQFKNGNALLFRINGETIHSESASGTATTSSNLSSISLAIGYQWISKSQKWKTTLFAIPKLASDFEKSVNERDWQYGGLILEEYKCSDKLQIKFGLFANREAFGNFFVPLLGIDWKVSDRIYCYGVLPASYKIEYNAVKNKMYTGINFKTNTRSFSISAAPNNEYVRFDEVVLKGFVDCEVYKNVVVTVDAGYSFGKSLLQYDSRSDDLSDANPIYTAIKKYPFFTVGMVYRIRKE
jgi:hypothetical protein